MKQDFNRALNQQTSPSDQEVHEFVWHAGNGDNDAVNASLDKYPHAIDSFSENSYGHLTALENAVESGLINTVSLLLKRGADVNLIREGTTPLGRAATNGNLAIAEILLKYGARVNLNPKAAVAPLEQAVWLNHYDVAKLLVAHGALPNLVDVEGDTPLMMLQRGIAALEKDFEHLKSTTDPEQKRRQETVSASLAKSRELETLFLQAISAQQKPKQQGPQP